MRQGARRPRIAILTIAGIGLAIGLFYVAEALRYPLGRMAQPGPGLYPFLLGLCLILVCVGVGVEEWLTRQSEANGIAWPQGGARLRVAAIIVACAGYVILLPYGGHILLGTLVMLVVFRVMGMRRWIWAVPLAFVMALASDYVFRGLLGVPLPGGLWVD